MATPNPAASGVRRDLLALLPPEAYDQVLDASCAAGGTVKLLRERLPSLTAVGVERDPRAAAMARRHVERVVVGDPERVLPELAAEGADFDLVLLGNTLEQMVDPWSALRTVRELCPRGRVALALANPAHITSLVSLADGHWSERPHASHTRQHLRWFGEKDLRPFFREAGFRELRREASHRLLTYAHPLNRRLEPWLERLPVVRRFTTDAFLCLLEPR